MGDLWKSTPFRYIKANALRDTEILADKIIYIREVQGREPICRDCPCRK